MSATATIAVASHAPLLLPAGKPAVASGVAPFASVIAALGQPADAAAGKPAVTSDGRQDPHDSRPEPLDGSAADVAGADQLEAVASQSPPKAAEFPVSPKPLAMAFSLPVLPSLKPSSGEVLPARTPGRASGRLRASGRFNASTVQQGDSDHAVAAMVVPIASTPRASEPTLLVAASAPHDSQDAATPEMTGAEPDATRPTGPAPRYTSAGTNSAATAGSELSSLAAEPASAPQTLVPATLQPEVRSLPPAGGPASAALATSAADGEQLATLRVGPPAASSARPPASGPPQPVGCVAAADVMRPVVSLGIAASSVRHVTVALKPAELGTVEIHVGRQPDGTTHVMLTAERPQTLHELVRDRDRLGAVLDQAGLASGRHTLEFRAAAPAADATLPRGDFGGLAGQSPGHDRPSGREPRPDQRTVPDELTGGVAGEAGGAPPAAHHPAAIAVAYGIDITA